MSDDWGQTLLSIAIMVASGIVSWFISELRSFRKDYADKAQILTESITALSNTLRDYVRKEECNFFMKDHCKKIDALAEKVDGNTKKLERISQYHTTIGNPID